VKKLLSNQVNQKQSKFQKKQKRESSDESSSESSSNEDEKAKSKVTPTEKAKSKVTPTKKAKDSSSESSSDEEASSEEAKEEPKLIKSNKGSEILKKEESSSESSSDDDDEKPQAKQPEKKSAKKDESSSESSDDDEKPQAKPEKRKEAETPKQEPIAKKLKQENGDSNGQTEGNQSLRVYLGNLSYSIDDDTIREVFKDVGEITEISWITDKDTGKFYGSGFLTFGSSEAVKKALSLSGTEVLGRPMRVEEEKRNAAKQGGGARKPPTSSTRPPGCKTVFLGNLSYSIDDKTIQDLFADCGEIKQIRWVTDRQTNEFKGIGFVEFCDEEGTTKAMAHNGETVMGRSIRIDYSESKRQDTPRKNW